MFTKKFFLMTIFFLMQTIWEKLFFKVGSVRNGAWKSNCYEIPKPKRTKKSWYYQFPIIEMLIVGIRVTQIKEYMSVK